MKSSLMDERMAVIPMGCTRPFNGPVIRPITMVAMHRGVVCRAARRDFERKGKIMKEIAKWIRHNQGIFVALIISAGVIVWTLGCETKVESLVEPDKKVNRAELLIEVESETTRLLAELDQLARLGVLRIEELDRKKAIASELMKFAAISTAGGGFNPSGLVTLAFSILGFGAVVDNRLKDKLIKNRPLQVLEPEQD